MALLSLLRYFNVTDLINRIVQVLREDLERLAISARDAGLMVMMMMKCLRTS